MKGKLQDQLGCLEMRLFCSFRLLSVLATFALSPTAFATPDIESIPPIGVVPVRCDINRQWDLAYMAEVIGGSVDEVVRLRLLRRLAAADICTMPESKLARARIKVGDPKPDSPDEAAKFREQQRRDATGNVDPLGLLKAIARRSEMLAEMNSLPDKGIAPQNAGINALSWTSLGPTNIGGRVRALATVPGSPNTLFAGSMGGGLWKTVDGAASWQPVQDFLSSLWVSTIAIDPTNPLVMYVGTGESVQNFRGGGVFKSVDGGLSWYVLPGANPVNNVAWLFVNRIAIQPGNSNVIVAATADGIFRTINAGVTWAQITSDAAMDVRFSPTNPSLVLAGGPYDGLVYRSSNAGLTFATIAVPTAAASTGTYWSRVEVAWSSSGNRAFAVVSSLGAGRERDGVFFASIDGGQTWNQRSSPYHMVGQGWYDNALWVDPTNDNMILIGGLDLHRSTDQGFTFKPISRWYCAPVQAHADHHAIVHASNFNSSNVRTVYFGNDGGVYKAANIDALLSQVDGPCNADGWQFASNGLANTQFYGVGVSATAIYGGTQDNGSIKWSGVGTTWNTVYGGDGGASAVDPVDPNYLFGEYIFATVHRSTNGAVASDISGGLTDAAPSTSNFIAPIALDPNAPNRLYVGALRLWRSDNAKASVPTWSVVKPATGTSGTSIISSISIAPINSNIVYVGQNDGRVFYTLNAAAAAPTWSEITCASSSPAFPLYSSVLRLVVDPVNPKVAYAGLGGYTSQNLWKLDVSGAQAVCSNIGSGLPPSPIRAIARHPTIDTWLYAGTEVGVFASENLGASWATSADGPANVAVDELVWQNNSTLIAATHGRGVWRAVVSTSTACSFAAKPTVLAAPEAGGAGLFVDISATRANCPWSATTAATWLTLTTSNGTGSGKLYFNAVANPGPPRSATILVGGQTVTVTQFGNGVTPVNGACGSANGGTFTVTPALNLCSTGNPTAVASTASSYNWSCSGAAGGSAVNCAATRVVPPCTTTLVDVPSLTYVYNLRDSPCTSQQRPLANLAARYYTFTLSQPRTVTLTTNAATEIAMYLFQGNSSTGALLAPNGVGAAGANSQLIVLNLAPGTYTIEVSATGANPPASFYLALSGSVQTGCTIIPISAPTVLSGNLAPGCFSPRSAGGQSYSKFYSFSLVQTSSVAVALVTHNSVSNPSFNPSVYLVRGGGLDGVTVASRINTLSDPLNSGFARATVGAANLAAGTYMIEVTTNEQSKGGQFDLDFHIAPPGCGVAALQTNAGQVNFLTSACQSARRPNPNTYAAYHSFTVPTATTVEINMLSRDVDAYLYLSSGSQPGGSLIASNDTYIGTNAQIVAPLAAGSYVIETTSFRANEVGEYLVNVTFPVASQCGSASGQSFPSVPRAGLCANGYLFFDVNGSGPFTWICNGYLQGGNSYNCSAQLSPASACPITSVSNNSTTAFALGSACVSPRRPFAPAYARYFTFTLPSATDVAINLVGGIDTYVNLLQGTGTAGDVVASDDDGLSGNNSILRLTNLAAGTYTVEATTHSPNTSGSLTLQIRSGNVLCNLDVTGKGGTFDDKDDVQIARFILGFRGNALTNGLSPLGGYRKLGSQVQAFVTPGTMFDVFARPNPGLPDSRDALVIHRLMSGVSDAGLFTGLTPPASGLFKSAGAVRAYVNSLCQTLF